MSRVPIPGPNAGGGIIDSVLHELVLERLATDGFLDDTAKLLAMMACEGDQELAAALEDSAVAPSPASPEVTTTPVGAFLRRSRWRDSGGSARSQHLPSVPGPA